MENRAMKPIMSFPLILDYRGTIVHQQRTHKGLSLRLGNWNFVWFDDALSGIPNVRAHESNNLHSPASTVGPQLGTFPRLGAELSELKI